MTKLFDDPEFFAKIQNRYFIHNLFFWGKLTTEEAEAFNLKEIIVPMLDLETDSLYCFNCHTFMGAASPITFHAPIICIPCMRSGNCNYYAYQDSLINLSRFMKYNNTVRAHNFLIEKLTSNNRGKGTWAYLYKNV